MGGVIVFCRAKSKSDGSAKSHIFSLEDHFGDDFDAWLKI